MAKKANQPKIFRDLENYRQVFDLFDKDGDGMVDQFELVQSLRDIGEDYTAVEAKKLLKSVDVDGNGVLDFDEFCTLILREGWDPPAAEHFKAKAEKDAIAAMSPRSKAKKRFSLPSQPKCVKCNKSAYPVESVKVDDITYHKRCFRCKHCDVKLTMKNMAMIHSDAYCKSHFKQLFQQSGGKYDRAFGDKFDTSSDPMAKKGVPASSSSTSSAVGSKKAPAEQKEVVQVAAQALSPEEPAKLVFVCNEPCGKTLRNPTLLVSHFKNQHNMDDEKLLTLIANGFSTFGDLK